MSKKKDRTERPGGGLRGAMDWWLRLASKARIRTRLLLGFALLAALLIVLAGVSIVTITGLADTADEVTTGAYPRSALLAEIQGEASKFVIAADQAILNAKAGNAGRVPDHVRRMDSIAGHVDEDLLALMEGDPERGIVPDDGDHDRADEGNMLAEAQAAWNELHGATHGWVESEVAATGIILNVEIDHDHVETEESVSGVTGIDQVEIKREKFLMVLDEISEDFSADVESAVEDVSATRTVAIQSSAIAAIIGVLVAVLIGFGTSQSITGPLSRAVTYSKAVAAGDFQAEIVHTSDEVGDLTKAVQAMKESLVRRMADLVAVAESVTQSADELAVTSEEIATTSRQLNSGAEAQSSAAEETSASIEQMAVSIDQVAGNSESLGVAADETSATINQMSVSVEQIAQSMAALSGAVDETSASVEEMTVSVEEVASRSSEVVKLSDQAVEKVESGATAVNSITNTAVALTRAIDNAADVMRSLGSRTQEIGEITEAIDDIAEQTNLLALNAAIEAARAGEHGRGFAVVAEAVRDLAGRATVSTREIAGLISSIKSDTAQAVEVTLAGAEEAAGSSKLADEARESLENIRSAFGEVTEAMAHIEQATSEQSKGGKQVLETVESMQSLHRQVDSAVQEQAKGSKRIVEAVEDMSSRVSQVASATSEQKRGGEQMVTAMEDISQTTRQNAGAVAGMAEAAVRLSEQADDLRQLVRGFSLEGEAPAAVVDEPQGSVVGDEDAAPESSTEEVVA